MHLGNNGTTSRFVKDNSQKEQKKFPKPSFKGNELTMTCSIFLFPLLLYFARLSYLYSLSIQFK